MPARTTYLELERIKFRVPFDIQYKKLKAAQKELMFMTFNKVQRAQWEENILAYSKKENPTQEEYLMIQANKHMLQLERALTGSQKICALLDKEVKGL